MSKDLNHITIIGRLVRDPEIRYAVQGVPVTRFTIANNQDYIKNGVKKEYVNYFEVSVWGNQAVNCEKYLQKGSRIAVIGSIKQNRWKDETTDQNRSKIEITASMIQFLFSPDAKQLSLSAGNPEGTNVNVIGRAKGKNEELEFNDPWLQDDVDDDLDLGFLPDDEF